jgi:hypothetical protein
MSENTKNGKPHVNWFIISILVATIATFLFFLWRDIICFEWSTSTINATAHRDVVIGLVVLKISALAVAGVACYLWYLFLTNAYQLWYQYKMEQDAREEREGLRKKTETTEKLKHLIGEGLKLKKELPTETFEVDETGKKKITTTAQQQKLTEKLIGLFEEMVDLETKKSA